MQRDVKDSINVNHAASELNDWIAMMCTRDLTDIEKELLDALKDTLDQFESDIEHATYLMTKEQDDAEHS